MARNPRPAGAQKTREEIDRRQKLGEISIVAREPRRPSGQSGLAPAAPVSPFPGRIGLFTNTIGGARVRLKPPGFVCTRAIWSNTELLRIIASAMPGSTFAVRWRNRTKSKWFSLQGRVVGNTRHDGRVKYRVISGDNFSPISTYFPPPADGPRVIGRFITQAPQVDEPSSLRAVRQQVRLRAQVGESIRFTFHLIPKGGDVRKATRHTWIGEVSRVFGKAGFCRVAWYHDKYSTYLFPPLSKRIIRHHVMLQHVEVSNHETACLYSSSSNAPIQRVADIIRFYISLLSPLVEKSNHRMKTHE